MDDQEKKIYVKLTLWAAWYISVMLFYTIWFTTSPQLPTVLTGAGR